MEEHHYWRLVFLRKGQLQKKYRHSLENPRTDPGFGNKTADRRVRLLEGAGWEAYSQKKAKRNDHERGYQEGKIYLQKLCTASA